MSTINSESKVVMHYRIALEDGTVADSTWEDNEPIAFTMGDGTMTPGLELSLIGLKVGDHETIVVEPDQAFGYKDTANIHRLPRSDFDSEMPLEEGMVIGFSLPDGAAARRKIEQAPTKKARIQTPAEALIPFTCRRG